MNEERCGCCEGLEKLTPVLIANRPGLDALAYRVGTHATFLETMKARLSSLCLGSDDECRAEGALRPLSQALTTRDPDDPAIALLDAWATVADVLTFYQERVANEGYLRTATERRSILELARLVGYKLRPGVAASVYLAFTMDKGYEEGSSVPAGTRAQSIPNPGELPQFFETSADLPARASWNELKPRMSRPQYITLANASQLDTLYFEGFTTNLKPNDPLLFIFGQDTNEQVFRRVKTVEADAAKDLTTVTLQPAGQPTSIVQAVQKIIETYLDLAAFGVDPDTQMAKRVVQLLQELQTPLTADISTEQLARLLKGILAPLQNEHAIAIEGAYRKLEPWVGGLRTELQAWEKLLAVDRGTVPALIAEDSTDPGPTTTVFELIEPLAKPPSRPPIAAAYLVRSPEQVFAAQADIVPRVLVAFNPMVKDTLYTAWANATVTPPLPLESSNALRVKASPFGHNAPLKPIRDDNGAVVDYEEWLIASTAISVNLIFDIPESEPVGLRAAASIPTVQVLISIKQEAQVWSAQVPLADQEVSLGDMTVRITLEIESGEGETLEGIIFDFVELQRIISLEPLDFGGEFSDRQAAFGLIVKIDDDPGRQILYGQTLQYTIGQRRVNLRFQQNEIFIAEESPTVLLPEAQTQIALDAEYDQIVPGSWVVIERPGGPTGDPIIIITRVEKVRTISRAAYGLTGKVTQLTLDQPWLEPTDTSLAVLRDTIIYAQGEPLSLAEEPITDDIAGSTIELAALHDGLEAGRWAVVSGERTDIGSSEGVRASELVMLAGVTHGVQSLKAEPAGSVELLRAARSASSSEVGEEAPPPDRPGEKTHTTLQLSDELAYTYKRDTVIIYGNVAEATHGETREEILGSGDGSQAFQQFTLKQSPLTHLAAPTPAGAESTLKVYVSDIQWHEADSLAALGQNDRRFITQTDEENKTTIIFGNGERGARLPSGIENVEAVYRNGIGQPGNVAAEQISLLVTRPLGLKSVINPQRASGGADRESRDLARRNTPLAVMALDRLVSVQDYADFARTFAGIGKASAVRLSDGHREFLHLTIAGANDIPIDEHSALYRNLGQALYQFGDPFLPIQVVFRQLKLLVVIGKVRVQPDYQWEAVKPKIETQLWDTFGFERRDLGQDVLLSEVISAIQAVEGVAYVDIDTLEGIAEDTSPADLENLAETLTGENQPKNRIVADLARVEEKIVTHTIKPGDTLYAIARQYNTTVADLVRLNRIPNPNLIYVDNTLFIRRERDIKPAQLVYLNANVPDTLILTELTS